MLNVENEPPPPPPDQTRSYAGQDRRRNQNEIGYTKLTPEEVKMHGECMSGLFFKFGVPFACLCEIISVMRAKGQVNTGAGTLLKKGFRFLGNIFLTALVFSPVCHYKLLNMHEELEKKERMKREGIPQGTEDSFSLQPISRFEDFVQPTDMMPGLNEPEFSPDFSFTTYDTSKLTDDEDKKFTTTYKTLREQNRNRYYGGAQPDSKIPDKPDPNEDRTPPRKVVKNKYGDEIE